MMRQAAILFRYGTNIPFKEPSAVPQMESTDRYHFNRQGQRRRCPAGGCFHAISPASPVYSGFFLAAFTS